MLIIRAVMKALLHGFKPFKLHTAKLTAITVEFYFFSGLSLELQGIDISDYLNIVTTKSDRFAYAEDHVLRPNP